MSHKRPHLSVLSHGLPITWAATHTYLCYHIEKLHSRYCQALRAYSCATVKINTLPLSSNSTHECRDWHYTQKSQTHPVACSHFGPLCCPSSRQWWLFSKLSPPTKACDHLSCQLASAETTNQSTVRLPLKISTQKMCHLHMFNDKFSLSIFANF